MDEKNKQAEPVAVIQALQDIGYEFGCPVGIKITDWLRLRLKQPKVAMDAIRKVKESLDPDDWCGDESMIDALERAESALSGGNGAGNGRVEVACVDRTQPVEVQGYSAGGVASDVVPCWEVSSRSASPAALTDELDLIVSVLTGYPKSMARADALRAVDSIRRLLAASPAAPTGDEAWTDAEIEEAVIEACHSDPLSSIPGEYRLTLDEIRSIVTLLAAQPPAAVEADKLREVVERTAETIKRQLELIAERAPGNYLDKRPVVQSLTAHYRRLTAAMSASKEA